MTFPENLKYTSDHEWLEINGNIGTIGITDHAQSELGDVVYVDLATDLTEVNKGDSLGTIEAVKTVSDIFAPISGKIIEFNSALNDSPEIVNTEPYGGGWFVKIEISDQSEVDSLLSQVDYKALIGL